LSSPCFLEMVTTRFDDLADLRGAALRANFFFAFGMVDFLASESYSTVA